MLFRYCGPLKSLNVLRIIANKRNETKSVLAFLVIPCHISRDLWDMLHFIASWNLQLPLGQWCVGNFYLKLKGKHCHNGFEDHLGHDYYEEN